MIMGRKKKKEVNQDALIQKIRERLEWYTFEATEEEFDSQEVQALLKLLMVIEEKSDGNGFDVEESWKRFPMYYEMRTEMEEAGFVFPETAASFEDAASGHAASGQAACSDNGKASEAGKKPARENAAWQKLPGKWTSRGGVSPLHKKNRGAVGIAAVILTAIVILGGTGVYAEQRGGFFHWLEKDENGVKFITSPDAEVEESITGTQVYKKIEDVPDKYSNLIYVPKTISNGWELQDIRVLALSYVESLKSHYKNEKGYHVELQVMVYHNDIYVSKWTFDGYEIIGEKTFDDDKVFDVYKKTSDDETEYAISCLTDKKRYIIQGNLELDELEKLAEEYILRILK